MKRSMEKRLDSMTIDEMFALRQTLQDLLGERLETRKAEIDRQLKALNRQSVNAGPVKRRSG